MTHRHRLLLLVLASLGTFGLGGLVFGAAPTPTRVLGLHVEGEKLSAKDRADLFQVLQARLRLYPDVELVSPPQGELTDEMIELECIDLDADCLTRLGQKYRSDKVVHVEVRPAGGARQLMRVRFIDVAQAKVAREKELKTDKVVELAAALELEVEAVFGKPPEPPAKGTLVIEADSPDAVIQLGADYLGTGTATAELAPGDYTVRISQQGMEDVIRKVVVRSGEITTSRVQMVAIPVGPDPGKKKGGDDDELDWVVWAIVGTVVVVGAVTVVALAAGGDDDVARGPAVLGIDPAGAWRDPATIGGRR